MFVGLFLGRGDDKKGKASPPVPKGSGEASMGREDDGGNLQSVRFGTVSRVIDGDTFDTDAGERVRLAAVDAPEYQRGCLSILSRERLIKLVLGKTVLLEPVAKDHFGRTVAYVFERNNNINKALLLEGLAELTSINKQDVYSVELKGAQDKARSLKRGIWSSICINTSKLGCTIKGNYRKDVNTYKFHLKNCPNYDRISINEREKDQWFCTEEEAVRAKFTKSEDCIQK